eukprot:scaffold2570_cov436-Prasinococcus_capsulatus_cf.AAC.1
MGFFADRAMQLHFLRLRSLCAVAMHLSKDPATRRNAKRSTVLSPLYLFEVAVSWRPLFEALSARAATAMVVTLVGIIVGTLLNSSSSSSSGGGGGGGSGEEEGAEKEGKAA